MAAREEESAREIAAEYLGQSVARTAAFDVAWPSSEEDTGGYAVLLIAAQTHVAAELPVRRVYLHTNDGREIELQRVGGERAQVAPGSAAASVFGPFREYSFYWAPLDGLVTPGALLVDFATGRSGFRVGALPLNPPDGYAGKPGKAEPNVPALMALRAREFPGFAPTNVSDK
jgi:hypothetical protein